MLFSPVGTLSDKLKIFQLRKRLMSETPEEIFSREERPTKDYLKKLGFSDRVRENFFRPFLAGIFLENELNTSSRMFEFVFKMFSEGQAAIPSRGM